MPEIIKNLEDYLYYYRAYCYEVTDGDTIKVNWDLGRKTSAPGEIIRLFGINTPERGKEGYKEATKFVVEKVANKNIMLKTFKDEDISGSFGRFLGIIFYKTEEGWINLNDELLENGLAVPYLP